MANVSKRSAKREELILNALRVWPVLTKAAEDAGIAFITLQRWMREDPEFADAVEAARKEGGHVLEDELVNRATSGDTTALIFALKAWYRSKYGDKHAIEQSGNVGLTVRVEYADADRNK